MLKAPRANLKQALIIKVGFKSEEDIIAFRKNYAVKRE